MSATLLGSGFPLKRSRLAGVQVVAFILLLLGGLAFSASARAAGGTATGWGENAYGQVSGPTASINGLTPVAGLSEVTQVAAGDYHTLATVSDGTVRAWGFNYEGQLGTGDISGPEACTVKSLACSRTPLVVPGLTNVVAVAAGTYHSLALLSNGTVMAWGENAGGQLGLGTSTGPEICNTYPCSTRPEPVPGLSNVVAIAAAYDASAAVLADGTVMTWGYNYEGALGLPPTENSCNCIDHPSPLPGVSNAVAMALGEYGGSALLADGTEMSWGKNSYGELGNGVVSAPPPSCECLPPVTVTGLSGLRSIAVGNYHRLAVLGDGSTRAWGENYVGQVGIGVESKTGCYCVLAPTQPIGLSSIRDIEADGYFSLALLLDGTVSSWGEGSSGQLGTGGDAERSTPGPINGLSGVSDISASEYGAFALVGPSQTLTVAFAGAGSGTVGADGIVCPAANCTAKVPQGRTEILRATSTAGGFAGFSGPCTGTGTCQINLSTDQTVTATFGVPKGTAITRSKVKSKKKKATFSFSAPGAITGYECKLIRPRPKPKKHKKAKARKPARFSACTSPAKYKKLKPGRYTFAVRALDILGADATPAVKKFTIRKPKPKKKKS
jgi:alpha-tubulin suppressor-like RCC1 family protein